MRFWLDTEFNGFNGELLSIALVSEEGPEFYEILEFPDVVDPWVQEHVIPVMNLPEEKWRWQNKKDMVRRNLQKYLMGFEAVHIIADWPADIAYFCQLLLTEVPGERIDTPPLTFEIVRTNAPSDVPHNALADARGMKAMAIAN